MLQNVKPWARQGTVYSPPMLPASSRHTRLCPAPAYAYAATLPTVESKRTAFDGIYYVRRACVSCSVVPRSLFIAAFAICCGVVLV